jgi:hypothetical protein
MPTVRGYFTLLLVSFTMVSGTAAMPTEAATDVECEIRLRQSSGDLRLEAVATSPIRTTGEYDLVIVKSSVGGMSEITQSGEFLANPGEEAILGEVTLDPGEDASVEATLKVKVIGTTVCDARFSP